MTNNMYDQEWQHAKDERPLATTEIVEHGWEQHVIINTKNKQVYRYPRNKAAAEKLADEVELLAFLHEHYSWPVNIPFLLEYTPHYSLYELIEGEVLTDNYLQNLSDHKKIEIGHSLGTFLAQLHRVDPMVVERKKTKQTTSLYSYYKKRIERSTSTWRSLAMQDLLALTAHNHANTVVHGDLHGLNVIVEPTNHQLNGVIDFSEVELGDAHQDFRKLFMTDELLLEPAVDAYQTANGQALSIDTIKRWAYVNEWANVCFFEQNENHPTFQRAYSNLSKWQRL